jgi:2-amino-4-hydroxy-6-hydroxymethyldihydropteridine diphosphokinase
MHRAYLGIGSNLGDPEANVRSGIDGLARVGTVKRVSSFYRTKPWGVRDQPDYINAVVELQTELEPRRLLEALKRLETDLGRVPSTRWGPRSIDFDILIFDDERVEEAGLRIPHPRMLGRGFVLVPLAEINASYESARDKLDPAELASVSRHDTQAG